MVASPARGSGVLGAGRAESGSLGQEKLDFINGIFVFEERLEVWGAKEKNGLCEERVLAIATGHLARLKKGQMLVPLGIGWDF
jgi:hypothetical protein